LGSLFLACSSIAASAQTPAPPNFQTYSFTQDPGVPFMGPVVVTVARDGPKEVIEQIMPVSDAQPKGFHSHLLYDFQARKIYTQVLSDPATPCSVMTYTSPAAPGELDVISGAADIMKDLNDTGKPPVQIGAETIGGVPTKIIDLSSPSAKGRAWIAINGGYPMKVTMIGPDGKEQTLIEIKGLTFTKPAASKFTPPANCQAIAGEATANGVTAQMGDQPSTPTNKVTAATLQPIPAYKGACPAHIKMTGTITTDGPGTVWYWFAAGQSDPGEEIKFDGAGTKTVSHTMTFAHPKYGNDMGAGALLQAVMEDSQGNHSPAGTGSNNSSFTLTCTN
jgi:hypothetical protein